MSGNTMFSGDEGLPSLIGRRVTLFCCNYIYTGDLAGISETCVRLDNGGIVFETGPFDDAAWKDYQALPGPVYVQLSAVESFMILKT